MASIDEELARVPLFEGLHAAALEAIRRQMQHQRFGVGEFICREGEPGDSLFVIRSGLAQVLVHRPEGAALVARLRRGDVVGEMSLVTGEPRSATVHAIVPTEVLELRRDTFGTLLADHPAILTNLTRILSQRLARANAPEERTRRRGETVALILAEGATVAAEVAARIIAATRSDGPRRTACLDLSASLPASLSGEGEEAALVAGRTAEGALAVLDELLATYGTVFIVADAGQEDLPDLLEQMNRILIVGTEAEAQRLGQEFYWGGEVALLTERPDSAPRSVDGLRVIRALDPARPDRDVAWLGRHLSRTKIGLAFGAGGAKTFAHIGAAAAIEAAGYTVDYVAGSGLGALVAAWLALGGDAASAEATMRGAFTLENVAALFPPISGEEAIAAGLQTLTRLCRETTGERSFSDLKIPLVVMAADLGAHRPAPITQGPLWEALLAATALPGLFPPHALGAQNLVDGQALIPVPSDAVRAAGADIVVSVNLLSGESLPAEPGDAPRSPEADTPGARTRDALLEMMDLATQETSARQAARADVVITPHFPPARWRDFHRADRFLAAGREAAEAQLEALHALANPDRGDGKR